MKEIHIRTFNYTTNATKLLTPEIVQMIGSIHEHKGKQELFLEANIDELKTLLEVALIQSTGASNRIEGIYTSDARLEKLVKQKAEPRNRSEQEMSVIKAGTYAASGMGKLVLMPFGAEVR